MTAYRASISLLTALTAWCLVACSSSASGPNGPAVAAPQGEAYVPRSIGAQALAAPPDVSALSYVPPATTGRITPNLTAPIVDDSGSYAGGPIIIGTNTAKGTGVEGYASASGGDGIVGMAPSSNAGGIAVFGESNGVAGYGVYGYSVQGTGVRGFSDNAGYYGGLFSNGTTGGTALYAQAENGNGIQGSATGGYGLYGTSVSADGVHGVTSATNGNSGTSGISTGTTGSAHGVYGRSSNGQGVYGTSLSNNGVEGHSSSSGGSGVAGIQRGTSSGSGDGVYSESADTTNLYEAIEAKADSSNTYIFEGFNASTNGLCTIDYNATLACTGGDVVKNVRTRHVNANGQRVLAYAAESTTATIEDFGTARMVDGVANVAIDAAFVALMDHKSYYVFLTPLGDTRGLYVSAKTPSAFQVRESQGGRSRLEFDYRIVAHPFDAKNDRLPPAPAMRMPREGMQLHQ